MFTFQVFSGVLEQFTSLLVAVLVFLAFHVMQRLCALLLADMCPLKQELILVLIRLSEPLQLVFKVMKNCSLG